MATLASFVLRTAKDTRALTKKLAKGHADMERFRKSALEFRAGIRAMVRVKPKEESTNKRTH